VDWVEMGILRPLDLAGRLGGTKKNMKKLRKERDVLMSWN
jgi:hypothetical protein